MKTVAPLKSREVRSAMALKALTLEDVREMTGISVPYLSQILNNPAAHPEKFETVREKVEEAPMPKEKAA